MFASFPRNVITATRNGWKDTHLGLLPAQFALQLRNLALQLLLFALPSLLALCDGGVHLYPELGSEAIFALRPGRFTGASRVNLHAKHTFRFLPLSVAEKQEGIRNKRNKMYHSFGFGSSTVCTDSFMNQTLVLSVSDNALQINNHAKCLKKKPSPSS